MTEFVRNYKPWCGHRWLAPDVVVELSGRGVDVSIEQVEKALRRHDVKGGASTDAIVVRFYADRYQELAKGTP